MKRVITIILFFILICVNGWANDEATLLEYFNQNSTNVERMSMSIINNKDGNHDEALRLKVFFSHYKPVGSSYILFFKTSTGRLFSNKITFAPNNKVKQKIRYLKRNQKLTIIPASVIKNPHGVLIYIIKEISLGWN